MNRLFLFVALAAPLAAEKIDHPTGYRTTPPIINSVTPRGISRGTTAELTIDGLNLAKASTILFDKAGVKGRVLRVKELPDLPEVRLGSNGTPSTVDLGPLPPRNRVAVEVEISPEAEIGPVNFRLVNPLGTSPEGRLLIEPYYGESPDREPNNTPESAFETFLPTILVGEISRPGDVDLYKIKVNAGDRIVFENGAVELGSTLEPVISILAGNQSVVAEFGRNRGRATQSFAHTFAEAGTYYIRVSDYEQGGRSSHFYRLKAGTFPLALSAFPLGVQKGATAEVAFRGLELGDLKLKIKGVADAGREDALVVRPVTPDGASFSEVRLAVGREPELMSAGTNTSLATAQPVTVPVTINGRIATPAGGVPVENYFRFRASKGQELVFEVNARRLGSELDSFIEVLDAKGNRIETATVRAALETTLVLRDHDSAQPNMRIQSDVGLAPGDYLLIGNEICRIDVLPPQPDDDIDLEAFGRQRIAYFGTSPEAHPVDRPVYKVQIHPPGAQFTPNGLPLVRLYAQNDDGGPGYDKDSYYRFTAPADGEYVVRIRDVGGFGGDDYAYRLTLRAARPDFRLSVNPRNPNVPSGGTIPLTVTTFRMDGFDEPIEAELEGLPAGFHASKGTIARGQVSTTLLLSADAGAKLEAPAALKVAGRARAGGEARVHYADPEDKLKLIALMPKPDVVMTAETKVVELEAGGKAEVKVAIVRQNGFGGRVPVEVRNLPPRVRPFNVGLNGVLLNEDESERTFTIEALPSATPVEQLIYVAARVETRSPLQTSYAAEQPILLKVKPRGMEVTGSLAGGISSDGRAPK